jgi:hypothetical protein
MMAQAEPLIYPADLSKATTVYSMQILNFSRDLEKSLIEGLIQEGAVPTDPWGAIVGLTLEGCYFFLHMTDRVAFTTLGDDGRASFVQSVEIRTLGNAGIWVKMIMDDPERTHSEKETLRQLASQAGDRYTVAISEYAQLKAAVPVNAPLAATVLGHYIRRSIDLLGMEPGPAVTVSLAMSAMALLKILNPDGLLNVWEKSQNPGHRAA